MHSRFTRWAVGATVALSLFGAAGVAQASSLTSVQVTAIISLLQSYGADQSVINNVSAALGGQTSSDLTCASFVGVSYGNFDDTPGGPVSQLQTWLGIDSSTFGFGTYGPKTQAAWNAKCGGTQSTSFSASPASGSAPLAVTFTASNFGTPESGSNYVVDFGDGSKGATSGSGSTMTVSHTYQNSGTYTVALNLEQNHCGSLTTWYGCLSELQEASTIVTVTSANTSANTFTDTSSAQEVSIYRDTSKTTGEHFLIPSQINAQSLPGFNYEGLAFHLYASQISGTVPLFRCIYNSMHFTSLDQNCEQPGAIRDVILGYLYLSQQPNTAPLYRYYDAKYGDHMTTFYFNGGGTVNGYTYENIQGYAPVN